MIKRPFVFFAAALAVACGSSQPSTTRMVGPAGATLQAGTTALTIPAGALAQDTQVTLREAEPRHAGRAARIEIEPRGQAVASAAKLSVQIDDKNVHVKMHGKDDQLLQAEIEDRNYGKFKTEMNELAEVEVELEHGAACTPACGTGQECDDGVCKADDANEQARTCTPVCDSGQECDDGVCKTHSEVEQEHGGGGTPGACTPACASGMECDNGVCKPHGG